MDRWSPVTAEAQARAVYEPAKAISEAVKTGDYATLVRKLPMMETQIADIKRYDATLKTMQREAGEAATGLTITPSKAIVEQPDHSPSGWPSTSSTAMPRRWHSALNSLSDQRFF